MDKKPHSRLWLYLTTLIFATICAVFLLISLLWTVLFRLGYITVAPHRAPLFIFALGSLLLGTVIAVYVGKLIVRPVQKIGSAFDQLSRGNFDVKIPENEPLMEIREIAQQFNAMTYDLSHIETLRSDFVANVSHEFKTPIAAIEGYATLLQNPNLSAEKSRRYLDKILENTHRLNSLCGNILLLSRLENQQLLPDQCQFRLDEQIRQCVLMLEERWSEKQLEFDIHLYRKSCYGSQAMLEQVWLNILDNAIKHSPAGGCIRIEMTEQENTLLVTVADQGDGMSPDVQKHIFEKFYQADSSHKSEGNGLGLALVKRIMDLCQGSVTVHSEPGQGAAFTLCLPQSHQKS